MLSPIYKPFVSRMLPVTPLNSKILPIVPLYPSDSKRPRGRGVETINVFLSPPALWYPA